MNSDTESPTEQRKGTPSIAEFTKELERGHKENETGDIIGEALSEASGLPNQPTSQVDTKQGWTLDTLRRNVVAAVSICLLSFPFAISIVISLNDRLEEPVVTYGASIVSLLIGFVSSSFINGGNIIFRSFTGTL